MMRHFILVMLTFVKLNYRCRPKYFYNTSGWILVEALVGVLIIAVALTALMTMYTQATKGSAATRDYTDAVYVAQRTLEEIKQYDNTANIADINSVSALVVSPQNVNNVVYTVTIAAQPISEANLSSKIYPYRVTVSWTSASSGAATMKTVQAVSYYYSK